MKIYQCDKCKNTLSNEKDLREVMFLGKRNEGQRQIFELCEKCRDELYELGINFLTNSNE